MRSRLLLALLVVWLRPAAAQVPAETEVLIVGAGLSGLAAAYELKKKGIGYHLLEVMPRVGGRVRTVRYPGGIYADSGMEEYWESNPAVGLLKELGLPVESYIAASSIVLEGRLHPLGDETQTRFQKRIFSAREFAALRAFKAEVAPWIRELRSGKKPRAELLRLKDQSFAAFVSGRGLPKKVSEWIRVSVECEVGTSWDEISALDGLAEFHIFLGEGERGYRVPGGNDRFTEALAEAVGRPRISVNKRVVRVTDRGDHAEVAYLDLETNAYGLVRAKHVVSTVPLYRLFEIQFEPALSDKKKLAIDSMGWGAYFKAHVFVSTGAQRFWTRDGLSILPVLSDSELGVVYDGNPDQEGVKIVSLLVSGVHAERFNMTPQDEARRRISEAFDRLWPGFSAEILRMEFYRYHPRAIAAWPRGRSRFDEQSEEVRRPEGRVYLAGDFTESSHSDGAFLSARRVVRQILGARAGRPAETAR